MKENIIKANNDYAKLYVLIKNCRRLIRFTSGNIIKILIRMKNTNFIY